jgi:hypothetical protein
VKTRQIAVVTFEFEKQEQVEGETAIPARLLFETPGETLVDQRMASIPDASPAPKSAQGSVSAMLAQANRGNRGRLLFQQLTIERESVYEVSYRYRTGALRTLWLYGQDRRVYAPNGPLAWLRIVAVTAVALLMIAGIIIATISLLH